ncbi:MAG: ATPase [Oligoflexia bacterium]|nr:ATPase [Oligoflexia bacterium]
MNQIKVLKNNGQLQDFSYEKLRKSLEFTGANDEVVQKVLEYISDNVYEGITSRSIYNLAFKRLRTISRPLSAYYGTKRALMELGPDGYTFEKFVARLFQKLGYETKTNIYIEGKCVTHEVDVIAEGKKNILVECKFHRTEDRRNDIKTALYVKARALDIEQGEIGHKYDEFWLVSNTSFSDDAIKYSTCAGLNLWGANFPPQNTLQDVIRDNNLHPITCLSSLRKSEKSMLIESEIFLIDEIKEKPKLLKDIGLTDSRITRVLNEIKKIKN